MKATITDQSNGWTITEDDGTAVFGPIYMPEAATEAEAIAAYNARMAPPDPVQEAEAELSARRGGAVMSKADFAIALVRDGVLSEAEATAWLTAGTLPVNAAAAVAALPVEQQMPARLKIMGATEVQRISPFVALLASAYSLTEAQVDALFA